MFKLWMKKISVVLITFMTLGMYIPPTYLTANAENKEVVPEKGNAHDEFVFAVPESGMEETLPESQYHSEYFIDTITEQAKEQAVSKLGPKILKQVEDEFSTTILPGIEEVLQTVLIEAGTEELPYYGITEQPAQGYGERIFNVYDYRTGQDLVRFHVRRDNRPGEGYWFNFHYHVSTDGFENHHVIGEIYWDKNTPPKWMS